MGLTAYSTEMFYALIDLNTAVSVASSATNDRVDLPAILYTHTSCFIRNLPVKNKL